VLQISSQNSLVSRLTFATSAGPEKPFYFQQFLDLTAGVAKLTNFATGCFLAGLITCLG
jgi:hypothetical protein